MAATMDWLKKNIPKGSIGAAGLALSLPAYTKELTSTENKLKAIVKITADWLTWTLKLLAPLRTFIISGVLVKGFIAVGDAIKGIVRSTGSLQAALERLKSVQFTQQQLAPLVGGMAAAKQRVAELITLSAKGPFRFEEIATANRSLEVFTRGMFSSAKATQMLGQASIASGNNITDVADAVGQLYQNLREGRSIESSVENLRQMGIVSDQAADNLIKMAHAGATTSEVFGSFTTSMQAAADGLGDMSDNLASVSAEHAKALEEMQKAFGAPWTQAEVNNTKNMTAAMVAITPAIGKISAGFAVLYNGMSTFRSTVIKSIAELPVFQKALVAVGQAFQVLLAGAALFGTIGLLTLLPKISGLAMSLSSTITGALMPTLVKMGVSFTAATQGAAIFANVLRGLAFITVGAGIITGLAAIAGTVISVIQQMKAEAREAENMRKEFDKTTQSIQAQIAGATTLAQRQEALAKATALVTASQDKLNQAWKESHTWQRALYNMVIAGPLMGTPGSAPRAKVTEAREERQRAKQLEREAFAATTAGLTSPERQAAMAQARERARVMEEEEFQERLAVKSGPGKARELQLQAAKLAGRAATGEAGVRTEAEVGEYEARRRQEIGLRMPKGAEREKALKDLQVEMLGKREFAAGPAGEDTAMSLRAKIERQRAALLAGAPGATEAFKAEQLKLSAGKIAGTDQERAAARLEIERLENAAETAEYYEKQTVQLKQQSEQLKLQAQLEKEQFKLTMSRVGADEKSAGLKGTSAQKAAAEYKIRQDQLKEEMRLEMTRKGGARPEVMHEIAARITAGRNEEKERVKAFETTSHEADIQLEIRRAKREGRSEDATALRNELAFEERFNQHRAEGMEDTEATQRAMAETAEDIRSRVIPGGPAAVVSSMQAIGGGGGIYAPGGDPALQTRKQMVRLIQDSNKYLQLISTKGEGVK